MLAALVETLAGVLPTAGYIGDYVRARYDWKDDRINTLVWVAVSCE